MVKWLWLIFMPLWLMALPSVNVEAELDNYQIVANQPLSATLMITHPESVEVDLASAMMGGNPLELALVKKVPLGDDQLIEIYKYKLPAYKPGEYEMPIIKIKVGDQTYSTLPAKFIVPEEGRLSRGEGVEPPFLGLEFEIKPSGETIYPGQRLSFIYRYVYRGEVELTKEKLPLFAPEGFIKIGEERVKDYVRNGDSIREVTLDVQAEEPGTYSFAASEIEGTGYQGSSQQNLKAQTKPLTLTIAPFPQQQQHPSFTGAQGTFSIKTSLLSSDHVSVGDKMLLAIDISGSENDRQNLRLPKLLCQPGFSGLFSFDPVPISSESTASKTRFVIPIRPTNDQVTEIPAVYFSFYNPSDKEYAIVTSDPISIHVSPVQNIASLASPEQLQGNSQENWKQELAALAPLNESDITLLSPKDMRNLVAGSWGVLWILPIGIAALAGQYEWKKRIDEKKAVQKKATASDLFKQAMASQGQEDLFYWLLTRAFITKLNEQKQISSTDVAIENLPEGDAKAFLVDLNRRRYGEGEKLVLNQVVEDARRIFKGMES